MTDEIRVVDRRTWRREPPGAAELARYWRQREEQIAAAQLRWATEIVNLDDE
jgi:hypothetical protein